MISKHSLSLNMEVSARNSAVLLTPTLSHLLGDSGWELTLKPSGVGIQITLEVDSLTRLVNLDSIMGSPQRAWKLVSYPMDFLTLAELQSKFEPVFEFYRNYENFLLAHYGEALEEIDLETSIELIDCGLLIMDALDTIPRFSDMHNDCNSHSLRSYVTGLTSRFRRRFPGNSTWPNRYQSDGSPLDIQSVNARVRNVIAKLYATPSRQQMMDHLTS